MERKIGLELLFLLSCMFLGGFVVLTSIQASSRIKNVTAEHIETHEQIKSDIYDLEKRVVLLERSLIKEKEQRSA